MEGIKVIVTCIIFLLFKTTTTTMKCGTCHYLGDDTYVCRDKSDMSKIRFRKRRTDSRAQSYFTLTDPQLTRLMKAIKVMKADWEQHQCLMKVAKALKADLKQHQQQQQQQREQQQHKEDGSIKEDEKELLREIRQTGKRIVQIVTEGIASSEPASTMDSS